MLHHYRTVANGVITVFIMVMSWKGDRKEGRKEGEREERLKQV